MVITMSGKKAKQIAPNKENIAKLTWTGKIIYLGEGFYVMINQPPRKQCRLKPFPGLKKP